MPKLVIVVYASALFGLSSSEFMRVAERQLQSDRKVVCKANYDAMYGCLMANPVKGQKPYPYPCVDEAAAYKSDVGKTCGKADNCVKCQAKLKPGFNPSISAYDDDGINPTTEERDDASQAELKTDFCTQCIKPLG